VIPVYLPPAPRAQPFEPCPRWWNDTTLSEMVSPRGPDRWLISIHKASHFVTGCFLGIRQAGAEASAESGRVRVPQPVDDPALTLPDEAVKEASLQLACWFLAGLMGERLALGLPLREHYVLDASYDAGIALQILTEVFGHGRHILHCQRWAAQILAAQWPCVVRCARLLEVRGKAPGVELLAAVAAGTVEALAS
jgi:hypothetical protein